MGRIKLTGVEHGPLQSVSVFGPSEWDRFMRSAAALPDDLFYRTSTGVRIGGYVGVVDLGWCQVEILPKVASFASDGERRTFLLDLLARSGLVPSPLVSRAAVRAGEERLLESLIGAFADQLHAELLHGIPRRYQERDDRLPLVKGRIRFDALVRSLPSEHHRLPVRHAPLQYDNVITRVLRALVEVLAREATAPRVLETLDHCDRMLGRASRLPLARVRPDRIRLAVHERRWRPYIELASIVREGQVPIPIRPGQADAFGLLFSLHDVFEKLIRRVLGRSHVTGLRLSTQPMTRRLLHPIDGGAACLTLRPDLLFEDGRGTPMVVADAKWKVLSSARRSMGMTPGDLYQVVTYMAAHQVDRGLLLFPQADWMEAGRVPWARRFRLAGGQGVLTIGGVDIVGLVSTNAQRRREATENLEELLTTALRPPHAAAALEN